MDKFAIIKGLPYLIHKGKAIPVSIKANGDFAYDEKQAKKTKEVGRYSVREILAKCDKLSSLGG